MRYHNIMRYYHPFPEAIPHSEAGSSRVTHPSATKIITEVIISVRLACVKRAASVRPEPGSNSLIKLYIKVYHHFDIDPLLHDLSLAITFSVFLFFLSRFDSLKGLIQLSAKLNFKGLFACSTLFNFQDTFFRCHSSS